jgi:hypothetical protein
LHKRVCRRCQAFLILQSPLFVLQNTIFQIKHFNILATENIYVMCMEYKEQRSYTRLDFITEKECVYYAVRSESINIIQVNLNL